MPSHSRPCLYVRSSWHIDTWLHILSGARFACMHTIKDGRIIAQNMSRADERFSWQALHSAETPIAHWDLKPHNVLLLNDTPKLCDFGLSQFLPGGEGLEVYVGSFKYQVTSEAPSACSLRLRTIALPSNLLMQYASSCRMSTSCCRHRKS